MHTHDFWLNKYPCLESLKNDINEQRLSHAYLIFGKDKEVEEIVRSFAKKIQCSQSTFDRECSEKKCSVCSQITQGIFVDFHEIRPSGQTMNISMETVLATSDLVQTTPLVSSKRICFIHSAEQMERAAANAFLKILEEPPCGSFWILSTENMDAILPTILSRCQKIFLPMDKEKDMLDGSCETKREIEDFLFTILSSSEKEKILILIDEFVDRFEKKFKKRDENKEEFERHILFLVQLIFRESSIFKYSKDAEKFILWPEKKQFFSQIASHITDETLEKIFSRILEIQNNLHYHVSLKLKLIHLTSPFKEIFS